MNEHETRYRQICESFKEQAAEGTFTPDHVPTLARGIAEELQQCVDLGWFDDETRKELEELLEPHLSSTATV